MNDDIMRRLRNWHDQRDSWQTLTEAADEIERLRLEVEHWRGLCFWFDSHYVCLWCDGWAANHLNDCTNKLHKIHDAIYDYEAKERNK